MEKVKLKAKKIFKILKKMTPMKAVEKMIVKLQLIELKKIDRNVFK